MVLKAKEKLQNKEKKPDGGRRKIDQFRKGKERGK